MKSSPKLAAIVLLWMMLSVSISHAGPANPNIQTLVQPDGYTFQAIPRGDEWLSWYETLDNQILVLNPVSNAYEYAQISLENDRKVLKSNGTRYAQNTASSSSISEEDLFEIWRDKQLVINPAHSQFFNGTSNNIGSLGEGAPAAANFPNGGVFKTLVVMVEFTDMNFVSSTSAADWNAKIFGGYPDEVAVDTVNHYYQETSNGLVQFAPATETFGVDNDGIVQVQLSIPHPQLAKRWVDWRPLLYDALVLANSHVDFASFDIDENGSLSRFELQLVFVVAGRESSWSGTETEGLWAHKWSFIGEQGFPSLDGVLVGRSDNNADGTYMAVGERHGPSNDSHDATIGIVAHELGHSALQLSDLYLAPFNIHYWGVMGVGSWGKRNSEEAGETPTHFCGFSKIQSGFIEPTVVTPSETEVTETVYNFTDTNNYNVLKLPIEDSSKYFLVEQRTVTGYDMGLTRVGLQPNDSGVLISLYDNNNRLFIKRANGNSHGTTSTTDLFFLGNNTELGPDTTPNSNTPDGEVTNVVIKDISAAANVMNVTIQKQSFVCGEYTSSAAEHEQAGRAYSEVTYFLWFPITTYYAVGSDDNLGTSSAAQKTLRETPQGFFSEGVCEDIEPPVDEAPVITLLGDNPLELNLGGVFTDPGATAVDVEDGDLTSQIIVAGSVNTAVEGAYDISYSVTDSADNTTTIIRTVNVINNTSSNTPPVITLLGDNPLSINLGDIFVDPGFTASDAEDGDLTTQVIVSGSVDTNVEGEYSLSYSVSDNAGEVTQITRVVNVIDNSGSTLDCVSAPNPDHVAANRAYACGNFGLNACAVGSDQDLGFLWGIQAVVLQETAPNFWELVSSCP